MMDLFSLEDDDASSLFITQESNGDNSDAISGENNLQFLVIQWIFNHHVYRLLVTQNISILTYQRMNLILFHLLKCLNLHQWKKCKYINTLVIH